MQRATLASQALALVLLFSWGASAEHQSDHLRYRFIFTRVANMARADALALGELELMSANGDILVGSARNPGGLTSLQEGPHAAIDGNVATKFCDLNFFVTNVTILELRLPVADMLTGYRLSTAADAPPVSWARWPTRSDPPMEIPSESSKSSRLQRPRCCSPGCSIRKPRTAPS